MSAARPNWYERHLLPWLLDIACGQGSRWRSYQFGLAALIAMLRLRPAHGPAPARE